MGELGPQSRSNPLFGVSARLGHDLHSARGVKNAAAPKGYGGRRHMDVKGARALADRIAESAKQAVTDLARSSEERNEPFSKLQLPEVRDQQDSLDATAAAVRP